MKTCCICKVEKETEEFNKNKSRKDGLNTVCKSCSRERSKKYYSENREHHKKNIYILRRKYLSELLKEVNEFKANLGCKFCPEKEAICLDFHHTDSLNKEDDVSKFVRSNQRKKAWEEIAKCVVVCSNCHRKIHAGLISVA